MARAFLVLLSLAALTLLPSPDAQAGGGLVEGEWFVGPRFGWSFPIGSLNEATVGSWSAGASVDWAFTDDFTFGAVVGTNRFDEQPEYIRSALDIEGDFEADLRIPNMTFHFRGLYQMHDRLHLFGKIAMGFYAKNSNVNWTDEVEGPQQYENSEPSAGSSLSAGFWIPVFGRNMLEVEMAYHKLWDDDPAFNVQTESSTFWLLTGSFLFSLGGSSQESSP
jgi:hypothetical protein